MRINKTFLRDRFLTIDVRTLGLARIYIALLLLFDLAKRGAEMSVWYFESGLLPNAMLAKYPLKPWGESFMFYVSSDTGVRVAFVLIALVYLALLFGVFTRVAQVLAAACLLSLQIRVDVVSNGGDFVFCNLMVWSAFLPLGSAFSFDAWRANKAGKPRSSPVVSWAVLVVMMQLAIIYFFNAVHKSGETWLDGSAVYWLANQERLVTGLGYWMREHLPFWVFQAITYTSLVIEYLLPFLILSPWGRPWTRRAAIAGIWGAPPRHRRGRERRRVLVRDDGVLDVSREPRRLGMAAREAAAASGRWRSLGGGADSTNFRCARPSHGGVRFAGVANAVLAVLVVAALSQVVAENPAISRFVKHEQPKWIKQTVMTFRLNQGWKMFAANAPRHDMWLVVDAVTADGKHIDPVNEVASRYADPSLRTVPPWLGQNYYWCDYSVRIKGYRRYHQALSDWIFRHHERTGNPDDRVVSFRIYEVSQFPPAPWEDEPRDVKAKVILSKRL